MDGGIARAGVEQNPALPPIVDGVGGRLQLGRHAAERRGGGNAVVDRLDDAADRLRAEAQGRGPAKDVDLLDRQWVYWHPMILAEIGDVAGADAVLLDAHPEIAEPAQDRAAGGRRKPGGGGARQGEE